MALQRRKKSLADKISCLVTAAPTNFDSDADSEDTKAKVVDRYDESDNSDSSFRISTIRRENVVHLDQLDERYKGKKVSRKDIYFDDDDSLNTSESEKEEEKMSNEAEKEGSNNDINNENEDYNEDSDYSEDNDS
ncbi:Protein AATF, partial [Dufourea novaeangliae]